MDVLIGIDEEENRDLDEARKRDLGQVRKEIAKKVAEAIGSDQDFKWNKKSFNLLSKERFQVS